ncbi:low molecular weight phosphotyrosine protein phosphatase 1 isoform X2 [Bactrocera oleae]|uniref:low molecular weight phosphotyrosine protein phosphatase 1 isoform X2 n=1 Tax=Bactrocera oleae TaxID=104688 RepID=UPI00387EC853
MVKKILMICLAEGVMIETIENAGASDEWKVDSAALGSWHVGNPPDHRALKIMQNHNINYKNKARQIKKDDFLQFDYIFGMDEENMSELRNLSPANSKAKLLLLGDFGLDKSDRIIVDPYYQRGDAGFEKAYQQCVVACAAFLKDAAAGKV